MVKQNMHPTENPIILHGVFLNILDIGTLITGASNSGKSTLALSLINRNHALIADDAPQFYRSNDQIIGSCPTELQDFLHIRELGFLNIRHLFGNKSSKTLQTLKLIINLQENAQHNNIEYLAGNWHQQSILGLEIPTLTLSPFSPHLITLIETAARIQKLQYTTDPQLTFSDIFRVSVLIISHNNIGNALVEATKMTYGKELPLQTHTIDVQCDTDPETLIPKLKLLVQKLNRNAGVLILTDLFGSTPYNVAQQIQTDAVAIVSGLNLPMLIRVMNYPDLTLTELAETALKGGQTGIMECESKGK